MERPIPVFPEGRKLAVCVYVCVYGSDISCSFCLCDVCG